MEVKYEFSEEYANSIELYLRLPKLFENLKNIALMLPKPFYSKLENCETLRSCETVSLIACLNWLKVCKFAWKGLAVNHRIFSSNDHLQKV